LLTAQTMSKPARINFFEGQGLPISRGRLLAAGVAVST
jgi:hypothetical protein